GRAAQGVAAGLGGAEPAGRSAQGSASPAPQGGEPREGEGRMMDIGEIQRLLPHRYPFLLVDKVVEIVPGQKLTAYKNVTINEPFFNGHFPGHPVMPGVLILEALAQASAILAYKSENMDPESK